MSEEKKESQDKKISKEEITADLFKKSVTTKTVTRNDSVAKTRIDQYSKSEE